MYGTVILPQLLGVLCAFPNVIGLVPQTSTLRCNPSPPVFAENFSGIYCSLLPLGCWSADSQRVVFDSAQRSRQVRAPVILRGNTDICPMISAKEPRTWGRVDICA